MDIECKKFAKEIRMLDKEMRAWETFVGLESTVKNTLTSLKAVGELQNPAIRERHWDQLMKSTKVYTKRRFIYHPCKYVYKNVYNTYLCPVYSVKSSKVIVNTLCYRI